MSTTPCLSHVRLCLHGCMSVLLQPALLYLVPACLVASLGTAVAMGELMKLWQYQEEEQKPAEAAPSKTTEAHPASTEPEVLNQ